jgi:ferric-dicitrate binding protein FerR (iron transport regulator)
MVNRALNMIEMDALLSKYFSGEATPEEAMIIDDWRMSKEENAKEFDVLWDAWNAASAKPHKQPDVPAAWRQMQPLAPRQKVKRITRFTWMAAAGLLICISVAAALLFQKEHQTDIRTVATTINKTEKILLPDSSVAIISPGSSLSYSASFNGKERSVILNGEAFFDVRHMAGKPFIVKAGLAKIKVLGTSFIVSDTGLAITTRVYSGKVMMYTDKESIIIPSEQTGVFQKHNQHLSITSFVFHFDDEDMQAVAADLSKAYRKKIFFKDPEIASLRISSNFDNKSLDYILQVIATTLNVNYTYLNQDEIYFEKN